MGMYMKDHSFRYWIKLKMIFDPILLELRKANSEDAKDHLHARTCQREAKKGRARSLGKSLNGHEREETTDMLTDNVLTIYEMWYNMI